MWTQILAFTWDESGPTAIEYSLIAALVSIAILAALVILGGALSNLFGYTGNTVNSMSG